MESFDLLAILGRERQVKMRRLLLGLVQAQRSLAPWAELDTVRRRPLRGHGYAERFECLEEEGEPASISRTADSGRAPLFLERRG